MNWKTTMVALAVLFTAVGIGGGGAWAEQHCTANPESLVNNLTDVQSYGESVVATGESVAGTFTFYGEAFDLSLGGAKSPLARTFTVLRDGVFEGEPTDTIQCSMGVGTNFRVLPESAQHRFDDGFMPIMTALVNDLTAFIIMTNPDNATWQIIRLDYMNTPFQMQSILAFGSDFVLYSDLDPEPADVPPSTTPWDG